jgi:hypothetical protein
MFNGRMESGVGGDLLGGAWEAVKNIHFSQLYVNHHRQPLGDDQSYQVPMTNLTLCYPTQGSPAKSFFSAKMTDKNTRMEANVSDYNVITNHAKKCRGIC